MNLAIAPDDAAHAGTPTPALRTLVVCDLVDSTALVERVGDARAAALFRRHDRAARDLIARHRGQEIDKTDGFLLVFERPVEALAFALDYQRCLRELSREEAVEIRARVGVHIGEIVVYRNAAEDVSRGAKRVEIEGLAKPVAARLMGLALPGQVLVSGTLQSLAQRQNTELVASFPAATWRFHGRYLFKGVPDPMPVYELGETGVAPLLRPVSTEKAWRARPRWLRPRVLLAELAVLVVAAALVLYATTRTRPAIAFAERDWVVLGDLRNLTKESVFDESLEAALRISLEQSRYVNVVPDLRVRLALQRMRRDPGESIDRVVGAEVALREGARALIVPTVAEVGGRLRISAELIDPATQTTVYAESADGVGASSVLPSVDAVTRELRLRLGEAMARIEEDSASLPQVTTSNIDALRAYALAQRAYLASDWRHAIELFRQALDLDPGFALAHAGIARVSISAEDRETAREHLAAALAASERLPPRERLYVSGLAANYGPPQLALDRWRAFGEIYPDAYAAHANYAVIAADQLNAYDDAIAAAGKAVSENYSWRGSTYYQLGIYHLALDRIDEAIALFRKADELGAGGTLMYSNAHAARRDFDAATKLYESGQRSDSLHFINAVTLPLDQGRWADAVAVLRSVRADAPPGLDRKLAVIGASLAVLDGRERGDEPSFALEARRAADAARDTDAVSWSHEAYVALVYAYLAAECGAPALARELHAPLAQSVVRAGYPQLAALATVVEATIARREGRLDEARALLAKGLAGREPYLWRIAMADVESARGAHDSAASAAEWLATHRGRAYAEYASGGVLRPYYVARSTLALLQAAEAHDAAGQHEKAADALMRFASAWPRTELLPPAIAERVRAAGSAD